MSGYLFNGDAVRRIGAAVRKVEGMRVAAAARLRRFAAGTQTQLCVFQGNLRSDGDPDAATPYVLALRRWPNDPRDEGDTTWKTAGEGQEFKVWPWKIPADYQIPDGWEVWVVRCGGRWYPLMPEDCLEEVPTE